MNIIEYAKQPIRQVHYYNSAVHTGNCAATPLPIYIFGSVGSPLFLYKCFYPIFGKAFCAKFSRRFEAVNWRDYRYPINANGADFEANNRARYDCLTVGGIRQLRHDAYKEGAFRLHHLLCNEQVNLTNMMDLFFWWWDSKCAVACRNPVFNNLTHIDISKL